MFRQTNIITRQKICIWRQIIKRSSTNRANVSHENNEEESKNLVLPKENAFPLYFAKNRGIGRPIYALIPGKNGELLADYPLFEATMKKCSVSWTCYNKMTSQERTIYIKHLKAVEARKLFYKCPLRGNFIKTVSQLLYDDRCCGKGCRHCPYDLEECDEETKKSKIWNGAYYID